MAMLIGITGGIGAGKSTVLAMLCARNCSAVDTDHLVHELYEPGTPVFQAVVARWGSACLTNGGTLDRAQVASRVFAERRELDWLNQLVHPWVYRRLTARAKQTAGLLFAAVPLLFEVGWQADMFCTVAVWCSRRVQDERLRERGWSERQIEQRLACQMDMNDKLQRADFVLVNDGSRELLRDQIDYLLKHIDSQVKGEQH